jgi:riboflavin kinase / FMN adenylyltransferase
MTFSGIVKKHLGRGSRLSFPTANLDVIQGVAEGVYLALTEVDGKSLPSLVFSGVPKTFGEDQDKLFEVYIFDFDRDLYGQEITVELVKRIRGVIKFNSAQELIEQMKEDERIAREFFKGYNNKHE